MIVNNMVSGEAVDCAGCEMISFGNNRFRGNGAGPGFTSTLAQK